VKKTVREWMQDRRVAAALAALAALLVIYRFYPSSVSKPPAAHAPSPPVIGRMESVPGHAADPSLPQAVGGAPAPPARKAGEIAWSWGRNPFLPLWREGSAGEAAVGAVGRSETEIPAKLKGTVISGNSGIAIFGSRLVPLGGTIGDWTLEKVVPYGVTLRRGSEVRVVELFKPAPSGGRGGGGDR
jgi:hypothetical protein